MLLEGNTRLVATPQGKSKEPFISEAGELHDEREHGGSIGGEDIRPASLSIQTFGGSR
jgi:hypothetical protein